MKLKNLVMVGTVVLLGGCGAEVTNESPVTPHTAPQTIPSGPASGTVHGAAWTMTGGDAQRISTSEGEKLFITLWDSARRTPCQMFSSATMIRQVTIMLKPVVGETPVRAMGSEGAFLGFAKVEPGGATETAVGTSGKIIIDSIGANVTGRFVSATVDGNSGGGEFSVQVCP